MGPGGSAVGDHEFGAQHTELKLSIVERYLKAYATALKPHFARIWYIDAFAGTGSRTVRVEAREGDLFDAAAPERVEQRRGSAQIAIDISPQFNRLIFFDTKPTHCAALRELAHRHQDRDIVVLEEDANRTIQSQIGSGDWKTTRAVMFLDPYGMDVEWGTLVATAATKAIDVWFLFSLSGLYRQATRRSGDIDAHKRAAITRILGTDAWERELYSEPPQADMFGAQEKQRIANVRGLEAYVKGRLETIFPKVFDPLALPVDQKPQRFSLFLCISNSEARAVGLATRIADHILKTGSSS
ncbi:MAG: three-Cys-motif partner protein TcmP [Xanthobacteraceae bacterium]|nr:three-Cys-motif partner protein TcmP [Xanthobacteraceae bacterium]